MITGYEAFGIYQALKLHFTTENFDYFKYNGKSKISVTSFENRKDKWFFYKLSRKFVNKKDRKSTRLNSSHSQQSRMPSSA